MTNLTEYIGRKIDVLAWRGGKPAGEVRLDQSLADEDSSGEITTGIQKLAQRFLIAFLTETGSIKYTPLAGTTFMTKMRQGRVHNEADMRACFALAELAVRGQMIGEESVEDPLDERYRSAILTTVIVTPGFANITIELRSRSARATFIVPIPIVV